MTVEDAKALVEICQVNISEKMKTVKATYYVAIVKIAKMSKKYLISKGGKKLILNKVKKIGIHMDVYSKN